VLDVFQFDAPPRPKPIDAELRGALVAAKHYLDLGESIPFNVLDRGLRDRLIAREAEIEAVMRPPTDDEISRLWLTFIDMRGGFKPSNAVEAHSIAKLRERDLSDVPLWAVAEAANAYRRGVIGAGSIKPPAGPIRKEAESRSSAFFAELALIRRVLTAHVAPAPTVESAARRRELAQKLREVAGSLH
jgi:hypothetical protein